MPKKLPHQQGIRQWIYTAHSQHYNWSMVVVARTVQEARRIGYHEAQRVFGNHARVHRDNIQEMV
jgi:hypothetical protein